MNLFARIARRFAPSATPEQIRMEIYLLGSRHRGEPLAGAALELLAPGLPLERLRLLHAVVNQLSQTPSASRDHRS
jgi:hypothetical protein